MDHEEARRAEAALEPVRIQEGACWSGCSPVPLRERLAVGSELPLAWTASMRQDRTGSSSSCTVQAPQTPCSQPTFVPSDRGPCRRKSERSVRGSTSASWRAAVHRDGDPVPHAASGLATARRTSSATSARRVRRSGPATSTTRREHTAARAASSSIRARERQLRLPVRVDQGSVRPRRARSPLLARPHRGKAGGAREREVAVDARMLDEGQRSPAPARTSMPTRSSSGSSAVVR